MTHPFARKRILLLSTVVVLLIALLLLWWRWSAMQAALAAIPHLTFYVVVSLVALVIVVFLLWVLWVGPQWEVRRIEQAMTEPLLPETRFNLENEARKNWAQILGGTVVIFGFFAGGANFAITQQEAEKNRQEAERNRLLTIEGQITERYGNAIAQLGEKNAVIRLAGVNTLARLAHESPKDKRSIVDVLLALVREHSATQAALPSAETDDKPVPPDIQACLVALGLTLKLEEGFFLDLSRADLRRASFTALKLGRANFTAANLTGSNLSAADFHEANLSAANLRGVIALRTNFKQAILSEAILEKANLAFADLSAALLTDANLQDANLQGANLQGANLLRANLRTVKNLTWEQLDAALSDETTQVPPELEARKQAKLSKR